MHKIHFGQSIDIQKGLLTGVFNDNQEAETKFLPEEKGLKYYSALPPESSNTWNELNVHFCQSLEEILHIVFPHQIEMSSQLGMNLPAAPFLSKNVSQAYWGNFFGVDFSKKKQGYLCLIRRRVDDELEHPIIAEHGKVYAAFRKDLMMDRPLRRALVKLKSTIEQGVPAFAKEGITNRRFSAVEVQHIFDFYSKWGTHFLSSVQWGDIQCQVLGYPISEFEAIRAGYEQFIARSKQQHAARTLINYIKEPYAPEIGKLFCFSNAIEKIDPCLTILELPESIVYKEGNSISVPIRLTFSPILGMVKPPFREQACRILKANLLATYGISLPLKLSSSSVPDVAFLYSKENEGSELQHFQRDSLVQSSSLLSVTQYLVLEGEKKKFFWQKQAVWAYYIDCTGDIVTIESENELPEIHFAKFNGACFIKVSENTQQYALVDGLLYNANGSVRSYSEVHPLRQLSSTSEVLDLIEGLERMTLLPLNEEEQQKIDIVRESISWWCQQLHPHAIDEKLLGQLTRLLFYTKVLSRSVFSLPAFQQKITVKQKLFLKEIIQDVERHVWIKGTAPEQATKGFYQSTGQLEILLAELQSGISLSQLELLEDTELFLKSLFINQRASLINMLEVEALINIPDILKDIARKVFSFQKPKEISIHRGTTLSERLELASQRAQWTLYALEMLRRPSSGSSLNDKYEMLQAIPYPRIYQFTNEEALVLSLRFRHFLAQFVLSGEKQVYEDIANQFQECAQIACSLVRIQLSILSVRNELYEQNKDYVHNKSLRALEKKLGALIIASLRYTQQPKLISTLQSLDLASLIPFSKSFLGPELPDQAVPEERDEKSVRYKVEGLDARQLKNGGWIINIPAHLPQANYLDTLLVDNLQLRLEGHSSKQAIDFTGSLLYENSIGHQWHHELTEASKKDDSFVLNDIKEQPFAGNYRLFGEFKKTTVEYIDLYIEAKGRQSGKPIRQDIVSKAWDFVYQLPTGQLFEKIEKQLSEQLSLLNSGVWIFSESSISSSLDLLQFQQLKTSVHLFSLENQNKALGVKINIDEGILKRATYSIDKLRRVLSNEVIQNLHEDAMENGFSCYHYPAPFNLISEHELELNGESWTGRVPLILEQSFSPIPVDKLKRVVGNLVDWKAYTLDFTQVVLLGSENILNWRLPWLYFFRKYFPKSPLLKIDFSHIKGTRFLKMQRVLLQIVSNGEDSDMLLFMAVDRNMGMIDSPGLYHNLNNRKKAAHCYVSSNLILSKLLPENWNKARNPNGFAFKAITDGQKYKLLCLGGSLSIEHKTGSVWRFLTGRCVIPFLNWQIHITESQFLIARFSSEDLSRVLDIEFYDSQAEEWLKLTIQYELQVTTRIGIKKGSQALVLDYKPEDTDVKFQLTHMDRIRNRKVIERIEQEIKTCLEEQIAQLLVPVLNIPIGNLEAFLNSKLLCLETSIPMNWTQAFWSNGLILEGDFLESQ